MTPTSAASRSTPMSSRQPRSARLVRPRSSAWKSTGRRRLAAGCGRRMVGSGFRRQPRRPATHPRRGGGRRKRPARDPGRLLAGGNARPRHPRVHRRAATGLGKPTGASLTEGQRLRARPRPNRSSSASRIGGGWRPAPVSPLIGCSSSTSIISPAPAAISAPAACIRQAEDVRAAHRPGVRAHPGTCRRVVRTARHGATGRVAARHRRALRRPASLAGAAASAAEGVMPRLRMSCGRARGAWSSCCRRGCVHAVGWPPARSPARSAVWPPRRAGGARRHRRTAGVGRGGRGALGAGRPARLRKGGAAPDTPIDLTDAVNAAALFAIVLELQGRDEMEITRVIDRVAGDEDPPTMRDLVFSPRLARGAARPPRPGAASRTAGRR